MPLHPCARPHEGRLVKLLGEFAKVKAGTVVAAEVCSQCGVRVCSKEIGLEDANVWVIPSELVNGEK